MYKLGDTIFALAGAPMRSALNIFRISGPSAHDVLVQLSNKDMFSPNKAQVVKLRYLDHIIDQAVVIYYKSPASFTGEEMAEIMIHGSPIVIADLSAILIKLDIRPALGGEFSARAFANKKIDLLQAEAINDLINSESIKSKELALKNLQGGSGEEIRKIITLITTLIATVSVGIDYPEYYDIKQISNVKAELEEIIKLLKKIKDYSLLAKSINSGIKVAIVGKPNVGKSTILNALLKQQRAITSPLPGTTRDVVEGRVIIGGVQFSFYDTAGIRQTDDPIEEMGVKKSIEAINESDIMLVVLDSDTPDSYDKEILSLTSDKRRLIIRNKADLSSVGEKYLLISAISGNVEKLEEELLKLSGLNNFDPTMTATLVNARQLGELEKAIDCLMTVYDNAHESEIDLFYKDLELARDALGRIIGDNVLPNIEEEVFARFCVGK